MRGQEDYQRCSAAAPCTPSVATITPAFALAGIVQSLMRCAWAAQKAHRECSEAPPCPSKSSRHDLCLWVWPVFSNI